MLVVALVLVLLPFPTSPVSPPLLESPVRALSSTCRAGPAPSTCGCGNPSSSPLPPAPLVSCTTPPASDPLILLVSGRSCCPPRCISISISAVPNPPSSPSSPLISIPSSPKSAKSPNGVSLLRSLTASSACASTSATVVVAAATAAATLPLPLPLPLADDKSAAFFECNASRAASWRRAREGASGRGDGRGRWSGDVVGG